MVMHIGGWTAPLGVTLVADELSSFMLVVSTMVSLAVLVYAISQGIADREVGTRRSRSRSSIRRS